MTLVTIKPRPVDGKAWKTSFLFKSPRMKPTKRMWLRQVGQSRGARPVGVDV
tara:strand:+ start:546 stop:701 length:156 start_codon:yes stop_codon:yes gene_type:complete